MVLRKGLVYDEVSFRKKLSLEASFIYGCPENGLNNIDDDIEFIAPDNERQIIWRNNICFIENKNGN